MSKAKLYAVLITFPLFFVLSFFAHVSALNWWIMTKKRDDKNTKSLFKSIIGIIGLYCIGSLCAPLSVSVLLSALLFFGNVGSIIFIVLLMLTILSIRYVKAFVIRKKFISNLKTACKNKECTLSKIHAGYLSLFHLPQGLTFTIEINGERYDCKVIAAISKNSVMHLQADGKGKIIHTIRLGKFELFHYVTLLKYDFQSDYRKLVLINPIPVKVYVTGDGKPREFDTGEKIGDYQFFNATGFLNALERDCLYK